MKKTFAVIGLGQFGVSLVEELIKLGLDVIAIDINKDAVKKVSPILSTAFIADSTDEEALKELKIGDAHTAIVAIGGKQEASVLTTLLLKELGVPNIIVRVDNPQYIPMIMKLGATDVVTPSVEAGTNLANRLNNDDFRDFYKLDNKYSIVSILINDQFVQAKLRDLNSKNLFGVNIVLVKRKRTSFVPGGNDSLLPGDTIYVVGTQSEIKAFRESINPSKKH